MHFFQQNTQGHKPSDAIFAPLISLSPSSKFDAISETSSGGSAKASEQPFIS